MNKTYSKKFKMLSTILLISLIAIIVLPICFSTTNAASDTIDIVMQDQNNIISSLNAYETTEKNQRLLSLTKNHIYLNMENSLEINSTKQIIDFDGNAYTLFELAPIGYIIYHNESGKFIEYSSTSISPYMKVNGTLYYGGAMQYYYQIENTLYHTLKDDTTIPISDLCYFAETSKEMNLALKENIATDNISFIIGTSSMKNTKIQSDSIQPRVPPYIPPKISREAFFTNLKTSTQIGYRGGGVCGYIAANMIIGYNYFAYDSKLINDTSFIDSTNKTMNGSGLTNKLLQSDGKNPSDNTFDGTTGATIKGAVKNYFNEIDSTIPWTIHYKLFAVDAVNTLKLGFPVALFGNLPKLYQNGNCNHAVVAYDYAKYGVGNTLTKYRVHYGWSGYSDVWLESPTVGTVFFMKFELKP